MISVTALLTPIILGAFLNLDKHVFGPFMVGRPLVIGFTIGLASGEIEAGLWLGLSAELLWLATLPLGGQLTPNSSLAVTAAFTAWLANGTNLPGAVDTYPGEAGLVLAFLTIPFWARAFTVIDKICRSRVEQQLIQARARLEAGHNPDFFLRNLKGGLTTFFYSLVALLIAVGLNSLILYAALQLIPDFILFNSGFIFAFIPFLGLLGMAVFLEAKSFNLYLYSLLATLLALSAAQ